MFNSESCDGIGIEIEILTVQFVLLLLLVPIVVALYLVSLMNDFLVRTVKRCEEDPALPLGKAGKSSISFLDLRRTYRSNDRDEATPFNS